MRSVRFPVLSCAASACVAFTAGCDAGHVEAVFLYKGDPPVLGPDATTFARVEQRTDPLKPGEPVTPVVTSPYEAHGGPLPTIPYGDNRVIIIEVRLSSDPDGQVVLYGISDRFSVNQGDNIRVPILLHPRSPPEPLAGASSLVIVTSTRAPGYTNQRRVELYLFAPESAVKARVSNLVDLPEGRSTIFDLEKLDAVESATIGYSGYRVPSWALDVEACVDPGRCRRDVYVRFTDNQEYSGPPAVASVVYDDVGPGLLADLTSVSPRVARDDARVVVNLTASETIFSPSMAVAQRVDFPLERVSPTDERVSSIFTFSSTHTAGSIGRDGTFLVRADLTDLAGNIARNVEVGAFTVDRKAITISNLVISPEHVGAGGVVTARFAYDEDLGAHGGLTVSFFNEAMACTSAGAAPAIEVTCTYVITGLEPELADNRELPVSAIVEAIDDAGNFTRAVSEPVLVDLRAPDIFAGSVSVEIVASPDNLLYRVPGPRPVIDQATFGSRAFVRFVLNELIAEEPTITSRPDGLSFRLIDHAGSSYAYEYTFLPGTYAQGPHALELIATDDVGNVATIVLSEGFDVDTTPPSAPDTLRITHERAPWGSDATGDLPSGSVEADASAVEASSTVVILAQPSITDFYLLGSTHADTSGGFSRFMLDRIEDYPEVYVVAIDAAGNASESTSGMPGVASRVRRGAWTASLRGKVPGNNTPNPHDAIALHSIERTLAQEPEMTSSLGAAEFAQLAGTDGQTYQVSTIRRWEEIVAPIDQPAARERAAMAYDVARARGVLFGGFGVTQNGNTPLRDTWEWDGQRWYSLTPAGSVPSERSGHAMVYDALHARTVMFGGEGTSGLLGDTWTFDGQSWTQLVSAGPSGRRGHSMTYDWVEGRVLLFGGDDGSGVRNDLWAWDGNAWDLLEDCASATCPPERSWATMIFDGSRIVVRGGSILPTGPAGPDSSSVPLPGAWAWENGVWTQITSTIPARFGAVHVSDTLRGSDLFFGGADAAGRYDSTWINGSAWASPTIDPPPPRALAASAFDLRLGQVIVFGGRDATGELLGETWAFTGATLSGGWRELVPRVEDRKEPIARQNHAMAYDPARREVLMFGGYDPQTGEQMGDTWSWNGSRWLEIEGRNTVRDGHAIAVEGSDCVLLFGGFDGASRLDAMELWRLTGWFNSNASVCGSTPSPSPPVRQELAMASTGLTTILFGGVGDPLASGELPRVLGDTWVRSGLVGRQWTELFPAVAPEPRRSHAMAARGTRVVLFGGGVEPTGPRLADNDVWEWDSGVAQWTRIQPNGMWPNARSEHAMAEDVHRGQVVLFGGQNRDQFRPPEEIFADTWEWSGGAWTRLATRGLPAARFGHALAYDHDQNRIALFGGAGASSTVWELHADPDQRAGVVLSFDTSELGIERASLRTLNARAAIGGLGFNGASPMTGAELALWNARVGRWDFPSSHVSGLATPSVLSASLFGAIEIRSALDTSGRVHVRIQTRAGIGAASDAASVATEGAELRLTYELPN